MARLRPVRSPAAERRRSEVERQLAAIGFTPSIDRLREALQGLGPVFAAFGRYLGSRADLLPVADCLVLASIPDVGEPSSPADRIVLELGAPLPELFAGFDEEPFEVHLLNQAHRAWLTTGEEVVVRIVHSALEERIEIETGLLPLLRPALPVRGLPLEEIIAGFRRTLADAIDFMVTAEALGNLSRHAADPDLPVVPEIHRRLTASGVLTARRLPGGPFTGSTLAAPGDEAGAYGLVRQLHRCWLRQALTSRYLPSEADLLCLPGGRLGCTGGTFAEIPGPSQANLWEYLRATAAQEPERIFACLVRELEAPRGGEGRADLRKRLRQVVPFGEERPGMSRESLIEHLIAHWRLIRQCGYRPQPHLLDFYRGLFWAARLGWRLAPAGEAAQDPLRDALDDLQWLDGWSQIQQLADPRRMAEMAEGYLATLAVLPQQVEQVLDRLARDGGLSPRAGTPAPRRSARDLSTVAIALGLAMAATALVTAKLATLPEGPGGRADRLGALIFLALGALLLWILGTRPAHRARSGKTRPPGPGI